MKRINCILQVISKIDGSSEKNIFKARGYYIERNNKIIIGFQNEGNKFKYIYYNNCLEICSNDSKYFFKNQTEMKSYIKNGNYKIEVATFTHKMLITDNEFKINYFIKSQGIVLGNYKTILSFC